MSLMSPQGPGVVVPTAEITAPGDVTCLGQVTAKVALASDKWNGPFAPWSPESVNLEARQAAADVSPFAEENVAFALGGGHESLHVKKLPGNEGGRRGSEEREFTGFAC